MADNSKMIPQACSLENVDCAFALVKVLFKKGMINEQTYENIVKHIKNSETLPKSA